MSSTPILKFKYIYIYIEKKRLPPTPSCMAIRFANIKKLSALVFTLTLTNTLHLKVSNKKKDLTVFNHFLWGVSIYGLPYRVGLQEKFSVMHEMKIDWITFFMYRTDKGGKNILFGWYMLTVRGTKRRSLILGKSVHYKRIEFGLCW